MIDRLTRLAKKWIVILFAATAALSLTRQSAVGRAESLETWLALALLCFVLYHIGRPLWRAWCWLRRRRPSDTARPELPTPAQWVTPRERRRTHDLR